VVKRTTGTQHRQIGAAREGPGDGAEQQPEAAEARDHDRRQPELPEIVDREVVRIARRIEHRHLVADRELRRAAAQRLDLVRLAARQSEAEDRGVHVAFALDLRHHAGRCRRRA
jgi:hypothetical protein